MMGACAAVTPGTVNTPVLRLGQSQGITLENLMCYEMLFEQENTFLRSAQATTGCTST